MKNTDANDDSNIKYHIVGIVAVVAISLGLVNGFLVSPWQEIAFLAVIVGGFIVAKSLLTNHRTHRNPDNEPETESLSIVDEPTYALPPEPATPPSSATYDDGRSRFDDKPGRRWTSLFLWNRTIFRHIKTDENDVKWLVIVSYTPTDRSPLRRRTWKSKERHIELDDTKFVDVRLATKVFFTPTDNEVKIYHLRRLHWWSYGPAQIGIIAVGIVVVGGVLFFGSVGVELSITTLILLIAVIGFGVWYYIEWMHWGYRFLMFTNAKVRYPYKPPFNLASSTPNVDLSSLTGGTTASSSWWGNTVGYGSLKTETVADTVDNWLLTQLNYIPDYVEVADLLDQLREDASR